MTPKTKKIISWVIKINILLYALGGILFYYFQEKVLFHPTPLAPDYVYKFDRPFEEVNIPYKKNSTINLVQFKLKDSLKPRGVVLYFHGNRANIEWYASSADMFNANGWEVWMMDYPGFGKSTGNFTEKEFYDWALIEYKLARVRYSRDSIIIYGRSLGTGIASQLASVRDCRALILETPFKSMTSLVFSKAPVYPAERMVKYRFDVYEYLKNVTAPVTVFAGSDDPTTPISNSEDLKEVMKPGDKFYIIEGGTHNNLPDFPLFHQKLDSIL